MRALTTLPSRREFLNGRLTLERGYPWLTVGAIVALEDILQPHHVVLELGCGGSTLFFAQRAQCVYSIDTDPVWHDRVKAVIPSNVRLSLCAFSGLSEYIATLPMVDVALVDHINPDKRGRQIDRLTAALAVAPHVVEGGWLVLDNYTRHGLAQFDRSGWNVWTCDDIRWSGQGTLLLQKKTS